MVEFFVSMIGFVLFFVCFSAIPWWMGRASNKRLMDRLLLLSEKDESLTPMKLSVQGGQLVTMFDAEVVDLSFHGVTQDDKTEMLYFEIVFPRLFFPKWMVLSLSPNDCAWRIDEHDISTDQMHTMTYPGLHELNHDLNIGVAGFYEFSIKNGRARLTARFNGEFGDRVATRVKRVVVQLINHLRGMQSQLPEEKWLMFLMLCQNNPSAHPVQLDALSVLLTQELHMPQVKALVDQAFEQWPEPMVVALLERSEAQFKMQRVIESLHIRLDTVDWTTRRWLNMASAAQQAQATQVVYQKIFDHCVQALGVEGIATLERQDKEIVVPLLIAMTSKDDSPGTYARLAALASPMLRWLDLEDATRWMARLSQQRPDLCDVKDFAMVVNRPRAQAHHPALARALAFVLSQYPDHLQQMAWCELVVTLCVHFGEDWAPRVFELILHHASPAIFGRLQQQISQAPNGKNSAMGRIFTHNKERLEETLRARQGGLTLADGGGPSGGLTLASSGGKLTLDD